MSKHHEVQSVTFTNDEIILNVDGATHRFDLGTASKRLLQASQAERERCEISPSGYGIHWPLIDENLSIDGLLDVVHTPSFVLKKAA